MQSLSRDVSPTLKRERSISPQSSETSRKKSLGNGDIDEKDGGDRTFETTSNQMVLYNPDTSNTNHDISNHVQNHTTSCRSLGPNSSNRVLPSIGAFTVQCAACFKWRLIPTKEKYEEIRERILQEPFECGRAREWRPDITCDDPADISPDGSRLWAIDKPNIAQPPPGWERLLRIRGEGSSKFADVYYVAPSGKRFRSTVEVERYLLEHPEYISQGVNISQFSFRTPRPLQENYVRKRPARMTNSYGDAGLGTPSLEPVEVNPLSWAAPPTHDELQMSGPCLSSPYREVHPLARPHLAPPPRRKKKKATDGLSSRLPFTNPMYMQQPTDHNLQDIQQESDTCSY